MKTENLILTIVVAFIFLFLLSEIFGMMGYNNYGYGMMGGMFGGFGFMPFFGWLFMILIFVALVLFIAWLVKQLQIPHETKKAGRRK